MRAEARLAILESAFFFLLASIITFALIGWRQLALFLSAMVAVAGRIALDYYYECMAGCSPLSAKISLMPIIALLAVTLAMISFRQHPILMAALFVILFVLVIWKVSLLLNCIDRATKCDKK
jgi:ABC-type proline/glycine betaine transport system permease subunit